MLVAIQECSDIEPAELRQCLVKLDEDKNVFLPCGTQVQIYPSDYHDEESIQKALQEIVGIDRDKMKKLLPFHECMRFIGAFPDA